MKTFLLKTFGLLIVYSMLLKMKYFKEKDFDTFLFYFGMYLVISSFEEEDFDISQKEWENTWK